jgi:hypothetical protein
MTKTREGTSQYKGVYWDKNAGKWRAQITRDGIREHLGYFTSERKASQAYNAAANR